MPAFAGADFGTGSLNAPPVCATRYARAADMVRHAQSVEDAAPYDWYCRMAAARSMAPV